MSLFLMGTACIRGERAEHQSMQMKVSTEAPGLGGAALAYHLERSPWSQVWFSSWQQESVCVCVLEGLFWNVLRKVWTGLSKGLLKSLLCPQWYYNLMPRENQELGKQVSSFPSLLLFQLSDIWTYFLCFQWVSLSSIYSPWYLSNFSTHGILWQRAQQVCLLNSTSFFLFCINRSRHGTEITVCQVPSKQVFSPARPSSSPALAWATLLEPHSSSAHVGAKRRGRNMNLSTTWHHSAFTHLLLAVLFLSCRCLLYYRFLC